MYGIIVLLLLLISAAEATTRYIAPSGSDSNDGLSTGSPWLTFAHAVPLLNAGDTLLLMNGVFTQATNGVLQVQCGVSGNNGTSGSPVTVKALNERQAHVQGDGSMQVLRVVSCSWWVIEGIYWTSADNTTGQGGDGSVMVFDTVSNSIVRRNIAAFTNRYFNSHLMEVLYNSDNNVIEENELYSSNRHGIMLYADSLSSMPSGNVIRRNYLNSRGYGNIPGGWTVGTVPDRGATAISCYPCKDNIFENNIAENWDAGYDMQCKGDCTDNKYYGNVNKNTAFGFGSNSRNEILGCCDVRIMPTRTVYKDHVSLEADRANSILAIHRASKDVVFDHITMMDSTNQTWFMDHNGADVGDDAPSFTAHDVLAMTVDDAGGSFDVTTWSIDRLRSFNVPAWSPVLTDGHYTNVTTSDPGMGTCKVFIPPTSNLKGAGTGGSDIGANVLYKYQGGVLTSQPLWDTVTGKFPCGVVVSGVSDIAGSSCTNVNERLNVNSGGCSLPSFAGDITTGLLSWWKFNQSGVDAGSAANDATLRGGALYAGVTQCKVGTACLSLDGTSQDAVVSQSGEYVLHASAFSVAAWVKDDTSAAVLNGVGNHRVVSWYDGVKSIALILGAQDDVDRHFYLVNAASADAQVRTATPVPTGWHHVVITYDGVSTYHAYLDGVVSESVSIVPKGVFTDNTTTLYIGQKGDNVGYIAGFLDDVRVYNRVLSVSDVALLYAFNETVPSVLRIVK